jgi:hypothetical protein
MLLKLCENWIKRWTKAIPKHAKQDLKRVITVHHVLMVLIQAQGQLNMSDLKKEDLYRRTR